MQHLMFISSFIVILFVDVTTGFAQTEFKIPPDSLPQQVMEQLHHKFHEYSVSTGTKKTDEKGRITYLLEVRKEKNSSETIVYQLVYDSGGKLVTKKKEKEFYYTGKEKKSTPAASSGGNQGGGHQH